MDESVHQISRVRNSGAKASRGRNLIFLDADTTVPTSTFCKALQALDSGEVGCGGATLCFDDHYGRWFSGRLLPYLWNFISVRFKLFAGSFIFCTSELFFNCGGFPESHFAGEEIVLSRKLKRETRKKRKRVLILTDEPVVSSARKLTWHSDWSIFTMILPLVLFPFFLKNHKACKFWYSRPSKD